jgi:hypothetical protein
MNSRPAWSTERDKQKRAGRERVRERERGERRGERGERREQAGKCG